MAEVEALQQQVNELRTSVEALTQQVAQGRAPTTSVRAPLPDTFKGQSDDFQYFIGTVRAYCDLTNVPMDKRVDLAVSCLAKGPAKIWGSHRAKFIKDNIATTSSTSLLLHLQEIHHMSAGPGGGV